MTWLAVAAGVILLLWLLGRIRLGADAEYSDQGLAARLRIGKIYIQLYPAKKKKKRAKKEEKKPSSKERPPEQTGSKGGKEPSSKSSPPKTGDEKEKKPKGGQLGPIRQYLPLVGQAAGELKRKIRIDRLDIDFIAGGDDPVAAAMSFGYSNAAMGMIWPIFAQNFQVKEHRLRTACDFGAPAPTVYLFAALSLRLGQLVSFALRFGWKFLKIYLNNKTKKEAN